MIDRLLIDVRRMDDDLRARLQRLLLAEPVARAQFPNALVTTLRDPAAVATALLKLTPEALCALSVLVDAGGPVRPEVVLGELRRLLGERTAAALELLNTFGLLVGTPATRLGLTVSIAEALTPMVPPVEPVLEATALASPEPVSLRFDVALVLALLGGARPRVNRDGRINVSDMRKLEKRMSAAPRLARCHERFVDSLIDAHLLRLGERVAQSPEAVARHFALPPVRWWSDLIARRVRGSHAIRRAFSLCAAAEGGWVAEATLLRVLRLRAWAGGVGAARDAAGELDEVAAALLLERACTADGQRYYRAPQPAMAETGRWVVQPSFEVLAPPDTPPHALAQLGRFAELERAEHFASFRISEAAVQLALDEGSSVDELLALLEQFAAHAVPQNVAQTMRGWVRAATRAFMCEGVAIQFEDAQRRARAVKLLEEERIEVTALGEHVIVVAPWEQVRVRNLLRKLDVRVLERARAAAHGGDYHGDHDNDDAWDWGVPVGDERALRIDDTMEAAPLQARLREHMRRAPPPPTATPDAALPATPPPASEVLAALERAARGGERLWLTLADGHQRLAHIERLRRRGGETYVEAVLLDDDVGYSIPLSTIVHARSHRAAAPTQAAARVGRNEPCPCGSGRKYKRCCLLGPAPASA